METTDSSLKNVIRAYEAYDEDKRLEADNVRRLEFMTTLVYMNKYLTTQIGRASCRERV